MTAPYAAQAADVVTQPFGLRSFCRATSPAWGADIDLEIVSWDLNVDETRIPHATATVVVKTPDPSVLEQLDPRAQVYIEVDVGYVYPNGALDVHNYIRLGLRTCEDTPVETTLTLASEEAFVDDGNVDAARSGGSVVTKTYTHELISDVLTTYTDVAIVPTLNNTRGAVALPSPHTGSYMPLRVRDKVERAKYWAAAVDAVLWCDQQGVWQFQPTPTISGAPQAVIATDTNMVTYRRRRSRDDGWGNRILAAYDVFDGQGWDLYPASPTGGGDTFRDKVARASFSYTPDLSSMDATGRVTPTDPAVYELLNRVRSRGRRLTIDTVVHLWLRAGDYIQVNLRGSVEDVLVSGYTARSTGAMQIITRTPE